MSKLFELQKNDFIKGGIVAVITAVLTSILQMLQNGGFVIDWMTVLNVAIVAGISYLLKNLGTNEQGKFAGRF